MVLGRAPGRALADLYAFGSTANLAGLRPDTTNDFPTEKSNASYAPGGAGSATRSVDTAESGRTTAASIGR
jgi:hypothetical protein